MQSQITMTPKPVHKVYTVICCTLLSLVLGGFIVMVVASAEPSGWGLIPFLVGSIFAAVCSVSCVWPDGWKWLEFSYPRARKDASGAVTVTHRGWRDHVPGVVFFIGGGLNAGAYLLMVLAGELEPNARLTLLSIVGVGIFPFLFLALPNWSITVESSRVALTIDKKSKRMELVSDNPEPIKLDDPKRTLGVRFHNLRLTPRSQELSFPGLHKRADGSYYYDWTPHPTAGVKRSELV